MKIDIRSEIGELEGVIIHTPGSEVENMTPQNAERALYSDILNLSVALKEYNQFKGVLNKFTKTFEVKDLLNDILSDDVAKETLINKICTNENVESIKNYLFSLPNDKLTEQLIEGTPLIVDNLTKFLSNERYSLQPLHNFFFIRDTSAAIRDNVLISCLSTQVREREAIIMDAIFNYHPNIKANTVNPINSVNLNNQITIEGGDILVARDDILLIGNGARTSTQGIDYILERLKEKKDRRHVIVQELPLSPESFIHLDMVFTLLDKNKCMIYEPIVMNQHSFQTVHIVIDNGEISSIKEEQNILKALQKLGMEMTPIYCGGNTDEWIQEREQWHSGANFFALGPGKVIGYGRNVYTLEEMNKHGFEIIIAEEIINDKVEVDSSYNYVITVDGSELSRGGGGCRCMTTPIKRKPVKW